MERLSTGISGLDSLIEGGIPRGFTVVLAGNPGTGKTILTAHFLYEGLSNKEENALYVSFGESKEQFYTNVERLGLHFEDFEKRLRFTFLDFASINKDGMRDAIDEILDTVRETHVRRLVIDSFSAISQAYGTLIDARIVLQTILGKIMRSEGITSMLISDVPFGRNSTSSGIEEFVSDGIILLEHGGDDATPTLVRVTKMRGTAIRKEPHVAEIGRRGMIVYPKQGMDLTYPASRERVPSGIPGLDDRIGTGLLRGTATALLGAAGVGKTTFSFQFLADGVLMGERGIFCSMEESADEIRRMGESYGYDVPALEKKGLTILAKNAEEKSPDAFISALAEQLRKTKSKRLVIDSLTSFEHTYRDEMFMITKRLASLIREYEVTAIFTVLVEQQHNIGLTNTAISSIFQNILMLRYVEIEGKMKRSLIILKMRSTSHDESILEFMITSGRQVDDGQEGMRRLGGISVVGAYDRYVGIVTGVAQKLPTREELRPTQEQPGKNQRDGKRSDRARSIKRVKSAR